MNEEVTVEMIDEQLKDLQELRVERLAAEEKK